MQSPLLHFHNGKQTTHNNVLIRSGEAQPVGWSRQMLYSGFNILHRSVFWSAYFNGRSDNLDVIPLKPKETQFHDSIRNLGRYLPSLGADR